MQEEGAVNSVGKSSMGFSASRAGDSPFGKDNAVYDAEKGIYQRGNLQIDVTNNASAHIIPVYQISDVAYGTYTVNTLEKDNPGSYDQLMHDNPPNEYYSRKLLKFYEKKRVKINKQYKKQAIN